MSAKRVLFSFLVLRSLIMHSPAYFRISGLEISRSASMHPMHTLGFVHPFLLTNMHLLTADLEMESFQILLMESLVKLCICSPCTRLVELETQPLHFQRYEC